jgi:hypothetical protein
MLLPFPLPLQNKELTSSLAGSFLGGNHRPSPLKNASDRAPQTKGNPEPRPLEGKARPFQHPFSFYPYALPAFFAKAP